MGAGEPEDAIRYSAFLSYSRHDARQAEWLQRAIESYRLPRSLRGPGLKPLLPVFRDMSELAAAPDLEDELRAALSASAHLIVLCSPSAAASVWVNREIELFQALHPDRPMLAALCAGDENRSFPPALRHVTHDGRAGTPLAADLRREHGGRRLAVVKLVARLADVGVDQLIQRDAQRRHRRALAIAVAGVLLAAVLLGLLVQAVRARREAEHQRAAAESLVEFMVGDLRTRLEPLGKLSILDAVGGRALRYYQDQKGDGGPDSLARRARVLRMVGDIQSQEGNLANAQTNFAAAADSTGLLLEQSPADPQRIFDHAQSVYYIGSIAYQRGDLRTAQLYFTKYSDLAEQLIRRDPGNLKWITERGYASSNLGTVLLQRGFNHDAETAFQRALAVSATLARVRPADATASDDLAQAHGWLADAMAREGRTDAALAERKAADVVYGAMLAADPDNRPAEADLLSNEISEAILLGRHGDEDEARMIVGRVADAAGTLARRDRANRGWAALGMSAALVAVDLDCRAGATAAARKHLAKAAEYVTIREHNMADQAIRQASLRIAESRLALADQRSQVAAAKAREALMLLRPVGRFPDRATALKYVRAFVDLSLSAQPGELDPAEPFTATVVKILKDQPERDYEFTEQLNRLTNPILRRQLNDN